jgi:ubiquinone/menaquinone biosynthesis C-methylase UbiE
MCLGCGTGNYTVALSEYVGKVTGLEVNEGMLGRAMDKTATFKNVSLTQGDITKMPFPDNRFDAICCNLVSVLKVTSYYYTVWPEIYVATT